MSALFTRTDGLCSPGLAGPNATYVLCSPLFLVLICPPPQQTWKRRGLANPHPQRSQARPPQGSPRDLRKEQSLHQARGRHERGPQKDGHRSVLSLVGRGASINLARLRKNPRSRNKESRRDNLPTLIAMTRGRPFPVSTNISRQRRSQTRPLESGRFIVVVQRCIACRPTHTPSRNLLLSHLPPNLRDQLQDSRRKPTAHSCLYRDITVRV